jgi:parallel beta-helix repeat protein
MIQNPHININFKNNSNIDSFFMGNTTDGLSLDSAYIIEDYSFDYDFSPNPSGIYIYNCSRFLLIKNCSFKGYYSGLYTAYSSNIRIENCYFTQLSRSVYTALSNDISIVNNTIQNCNDAGIELSYSNNNLIERNNLINNSDGINLLSSNNNTIQMNKITNHYFTGINNLWAENNVIYNNEISSNRFFGIKISNSQNTTIWYNIFTKNGKFNAYTSVSVNFNSQDQIKTPNKWDNGSVGNFWDDYLFNNPFGIKQDGFWKKKYTIPGLSSEFDHHPLIHPNDNIRFNSTMLFIIILVSGIACISIMAYKSIRKNISREENFFVRQFSDN